MNTGARNTTEVERREATDGTYNCVSKSPETVGINSVAVRELFGEQ